MTIKKDKILFVKDLFILIFFAYFLAIRPIEGDTFHYFQFFDNLNSILDIPKQLIFYLSSIDYVFGFFTFLVKQISNNFVFYLFILDLFVLGSIYYFSKEFFNKNKLILILLFIASPVYFFILGNAIRQGLGIGFFILFIYFFLQKKRLLSILFLVFAIFSHPVYIVVFPFLIFNKLFYKYDFLLIFSVFLFFILILLHIDIITTFIGMFENFYAQKYLGYAKHHQTNIISILSFDIVKSFILYLFIIKFYNKLKEFKSIIILFLYLFAIQLLVFYNQLVFVRIASLKEVVEMILIILFINKLQNNQKKLAYILLVGYIVFNFLRFVK